MLSIAIVCGAGASSTFLARRLTELSLSSSREWTFTPHSLDVVNAETADVVALSHHVATEFAVNDLTNRGITVVVLPGTVRGGFGADAALEAIADFIDNNVSKSNDSVAFAQSQGQST
jgi:cellobiose-specific phosphotransferase system component IIB